MLNKFVKVLVIIVMIILVSPNKNIQAEGLASENVIVLFKDEIDFSLIEKIKGKVLFQYNSVNGVSMRVPANVISLLEALPQVKSVQYDNQFQLQKQITDWGAVETKADITVQSGVTGAGVKVAVLDTGIDTTHPDLQVSGGICLIPETLYQGNCTSYNDDNGHGTHVAGIIAAQNNDIGAVGVAPDAKLFAIKVLDGEGLGTTSSIMAGIEWAIENKMDIINLSLTTPELDPAMEVLIDEAYNKGILIVGSAGNNGKTLGNTDTIEYPAKFDSVIAVGSINSLKNRSATSATGASLEIVAPGDSIYSTLPKAYDYDGNQDGYGWMTGTSMATPFITGILAGYKEQFPEKANIELRQLLIDQAIDLGLEGKDPWYGYGLAQSGAFAKITETMLDVSMVANESGIVSFEVVSLPENYNAYNIYRNGVLIKKNATNLSFTDYVLKGNYEYQFAALSLDGRESLLTNSLTVEVNSPYFKDIKNQNWFSPHIVFLTSQSILTGYDDNAIRPQETVTRAQAITMIGRALRLDGTKKNTVFSDVNSESFASGYIQSAFESGIVKGFTDGTIRPNQPVTRVEMAIMVSNAYKLTATGTLAFTDVSSNVTGHEAISRIATFGITKGFKDGTFKPYQFMTRSDFSVFIARAENPLFR
ncbi:S8 family serine peptidase [Cytobacillus sp. S13-E01]|uniref:S8 family peptidase n=1 Tax=Cytobacillus sp. S13-E01 TaxID=3031326 RepID=UPI0023D862F9|nr:S8 family serine peptidase [Cytobacillus sp. S13-E01]MDF0726041.1 S8 family serine peptidase [Cytobacillus sp. S13-E01]